MIYTRSGAGDSHRLSRPVSRRLPSRGIYQRLDPVSCLPLYIYKRSTPQNRGGTQSRGVICSASTNRPDCQRSRCRNTSTGTQNSEEPRPCPLLRHPEYYRNIRGRSRTFSKTRITFWEPPLPVPKIQASLIHTRPHPEKRHAIPPQILNPHTRIAALRNGIPHPARPPDNHQAKPREKPPESASGNRRKSLPHKIATPVCETESAPIRQPARIRPDPVS